MLNKKDLNSFFAGEFGQDEKEAAVDSREAMIEQLKQNKGYLYPNTKEAAETILDQFQRRRSLSEKQWAFVANMVQWAGERKEALAKPKKGQELGGKGLKPMLVMFQLAAQHLKVPRIHLRTDMGEHITLHRATKASKTPGHIFVKGEGGVYYGRITPDGELFPSRELKAHPDVLRCLHAFAENPRQAALAYARMENRCCFCHQALTGEDEVSKKLGYGPTCARHYDLPWGKEAVKELEREKNPEFKSSYGGQWCGA